jgi:class 3 adenylate cyclase
VRESAGAGELDVELTLRFPDAEVRSIPLRGLHVIGRECDGVPEEQRVLIDDPGVSRHHLELRVDRAAGVVYVIDTSTNGTYLNGARLDRAVIVPLRSGDRLRIGKVEAELAVSGATVGADPARSTVRSVSNFEMVHVVGDIVDYSGLSQLNGSAVLAAAVDVLFGELRALVQAKSGTLANLAGDALYSVWDLGGGRELATEHALEFVLQATEVVENVRPALELETGAAPLRMGWGVTVGEASITLLAGSLVTILGDATNVAFRLSGVAGREGRPKILLDESVEPVASTRFVLGTPMPLMLKGRAQESRARGLLRDSGSESSPTIA